MDGDSEWGFKTADEMKFNCPNCGAEMEEGYLTVPLHFNLHSIKWSKTSEHRIMSGEVIYDPKWHLESTHFLKTGSVLRAYRCRRCMIVVFAYPPPGYPLESGSEKAV